MCNWSGLGGLALDNGNVRAALGFDQNITGGSGVLPTSTAHLWHHSISGGLKTAQTSINLSDFL